MNHQQKNDKTEDKESKRTCQKNKRGDTKEDSNDSPEIPERVKSVCVGEGRGGGAGIGHPWPPFGGKATQNT